MSKKCAELLAKKRLKITFIESATAGYLSHRLSLTPYSGDILIGGLVCYDLCVKTDTLHISPKLIEKYSAESAQVTQELVKKSLNLFKSDVYVACTGLLKRGGSETPEKPVGTFFCCIYYQGTYHDFVCVCQGKPSEKLRTIYKNISKSIISVIKASR